MSWSPIDYPDNKKELYELLEAMTASVVDGVPHVTANLANISALLADALVDINWVGFYLMEGGQLVLGPFQGKLACVEIQVGEGVCGTAVAQKATQLVYDVHEFPGHIACDSASSSEVVVPLFVNGEVIGVLDVDSPLVGRFDEEDKAGLEAVARAVEAIFPR